VNTLQWATIKELNALDITSDDS
jgi:hypothetical protein